MTTTRAQIDEQWDAWYATLPARLKARLSIADFKLLGDNLYRIFVLEKQPAAEVGEQDWQCGYEAGMKSAVPAIDVLQKNIREIEAATIERCAQVIRDRATQYDLNNNQEHALYVECEENIAAIHALKEKP